MLAHDFDCQPNLCGSTLRLEPLADSDFVGMYQAAADPDIWAGHPAKDRYKCEVFEVYFASLLATKKALAVIDIESGEIVGTSSTTRRRICPTASPSVLPFWCVRNEGAILIAS